MVSMLSVGFPGSKKTRLLKHGRAGKLVEYVDASWIAKPCGRSSRSITLREPPLFGVCAVASGTAAMIRTMARAGRSVRGEKRKRFIVFPFLDAVSASPFGGPNVMPVAGKPRRGPKRSRGREHYTAKARAPTTR